jgi:FdhD protein
MSNASVTNTSIIRVENKQSNQVEDLLAVEEPLEIRIGYGPEHHRKEISLAVTMRTPGHDEILVIGLLRTEGIINDKLDIVSLKYCLSSEHPGNIIRAQLAHSVFFEEEKFQRNLLSSSSCGICGKAYIDSIIHKTQNLNNVPSHISSNILHDLANKLSIKQTVFQHTGGIHAAALFEANGTLVLSNEDIGRHNALDKLIGTMVSKNIDSNNKFILLSGRVGFELVQKCLMANIKTIIALGAPSSLSVQMAIENKMCLVGFLKSDKYNIYSGAEYIQV